MEAIAAGTAMIAYADGFISHEETAKLIEYIQIDENLKVFDLADVLDAFEKVIQDFEFDPKLGMEKAFKTIRQINRNTEEARILLMVCCAIAKADLEFTENEMKAVREICQVLGMNPAEFEVARQQTPPPLKRFPDTTSKSFPQDNIPDSMRTFHPKPVPTESRQKKSEKKFPDNIPEWMKNPPIQQDSRNRDSDIPDWMKKIPKSAPKKNKQNSIPDWMKNPRQNVDRKKKQSSDDSLPDWMKDPSKK